MPTRNARKVIYSDNGITTYPDDETLIHPTYSEERKARLYDIVENRNKNPDTWVRENIINFEWERLV